MRFILTLFLSSNIFYHVQAELTNIEGYLIDLEKLEPPVVDVDKPSTFFRRLMPFSDSNVSNIIQGQDSTDQKQFPYQAALFLKRKNDKTHSSFCGGSLISRKVILTAAHCLEKIVEVAICLGCMNLKNDQEKGREMFVVGKSSMIIHKQWNSRTLKNDIALIILPREAPLTDVIKPLKLPAGAQSRELISPLWRFPSSVSGMNASGVSKKLKYISTLVMRQDDCKKIYLSKHKYNVETTQLCTDGSQGKSTCQGDSGGPLVIKSGNEYVQIGIVSFGTRDCERREPSVYTRVNYFLPWIQAKMSSVK
ncbi:hypothetical protein LSTR_LSTR001244 [Laodelphax striatellus]|uniref:Peptidase S1 domain-containing protein n=1 Tax=Laodelphax striatellus TaxID=195883 RepID=A0A482XBE8_LAOST|nr:hypothetical protein LSTR_LSTR001244 [Laodelphax striatellus]